MGEERTGELEEFLKKVRRRFSPVVVILFGSRSRGEYLKQSDYDLIIVSKKFEGMHFLERIYQLLEFWDCDADVDLLPYTPDEFKKKKEEIGIVKEAVKEGMEV
jgi:predicted nucleotidyltransferase